jgi:hypothetical protein
MVKAVLGFLLIMVLIGMIGNALTGGWLKGVLTRKVSRGVVDTCPRCGRYLIGKSGCDCRKGRG